MGESTGGASGMPTPSPSPSTAAALDGAFYVLHAAFGLLLVVALWMGCVRTIRDARARRSSRKTKETMVYYYEKRKQLGNHRFLRSSYLIGAIVYVTALTYAQLILSPGLLSLGQVFGLLLAYFVVAVVCWSMAVALVPFFEGILLDYNSILSSLIFVLYACYCNYGELMGVMRGVNHVERLVAYNLFWLLEDAPLTTYLPILGTITFMHLLSYIQSYSAVLYQPLQLLGNLGLYVSLGLVMPLVSHLIIRYSTKPSRLPSAMFSAVCAVANALSVGDLLLRTPKLVDPLQEAARNGSMVAGALVGIMESHPGPAGVAGADGDAAVNRYGLPQDLLLSVMATLLGFVMLCTFVLAISEEPASTDPTPHSALVKAMQKNQAMLTVLGFMRSLPTNKKYALCGMMGVSALQATGIVTITVKSVFAAPGEVVTSAPVILLSIMLGVIVQVVGVLYIIMPNHNAPVGQESSMRVGRPGDDSIGMHQGGLNSSNTLLSSGLTNSVAGAGMGLGMGRDSVGVDSVRDGPGNQDPNDFRVRIEALANFKTFMTGLDSQPGVYSLDEFIKGAANAMRGVFPQVHHASFCLLNSSRTSVNMYTFLGEGSQKPPRINVAVAPGTLIFHVLNNCQPVFISDIANFPGPYSDVQFMRFVLGLRSVACLPLVVANARILGVLRLGFEAPWQWVEHEKSLSKQLALVLSSGSHSLGSGQAGGRAGSVAGGDERSPESSARQSMAAGHAGMGGMAYPGRVSNSGSMGGAVFADPNAGARLNQQMLALQQQQQLMAGGGSNSHMQGVMASALPQHMMGPGSIGGRGSGQYGVHGAASQPIFAGVGSVAGDSHANSSMNNRMPNPRRSSTVGDLGMGQGWPGSNYAGAMDAGHDDDGVSVHSGSTMKAAGSGFGYAPGTNVRRQGSSLAPQNQQGSSQSMGAGQGMGGQPNPQTDLKMMEVIGRGGFGSVYKAFWKGKLVAVKVLEHGDEFVGCADNGGERRKDTSGRRAALLEGAMTSTISHPNVVQTYDYRVVHLNPTPTTAMSLSSNRVVQETHIIMEWCDRGSLQDAIEQGALLLDRTQRNTPEPVIDMQILVMTLAEVAAAMEYLHAHRITHRDLKPKNVLLRTSQKDRRGFCAKVSDFGLSQVLPENNRTQVSQKYSGTVTHMPPELIEDGKVYPQGDVYAFGIMMWEAYTGSTPYQSMAHPQIMVAVVTHNLRPKFPESCPEWYKSLAYKCWRKDPKLRPGFTEVAAALQQMVEDKVWQPVGDGLTPAPAP